VLVRCIMQSASAVACLLATPRFALLPPHPTSVGTTVTASLHVPNAAPCCADGRHYKHFHLVGKSVLAAELLTGPLLGQLTRMDCTQRAPGACGNSIVERTAVPPHTQ
jgi:hypothetical protein